MNISVIKDNEFLFSVDLGEEIKGTNGAETTFFVGRSATCHVVLDDKQVSREHAKIVFENNIWTLKKTSDFNILTVNGNNCESNVLKTGDIISIGPYTLSLVIPVIENASLGPTEDDMEISGIPDNDLSGVDLGFGDEEATELMTESDLEAELADMPVEDDFGDLEDDAGGLGDDVDGFNDDFGDNELGDALPEQENEFSDDSFGEGDQANFSDEFSEENAGNDEFNDGFDDGFQDDEYAMDSYDEDEKTQVLSSFAKFELEIFGEYAPYDKFNLEKPETFIGRDPEKCDIILNDPEVSGVHAVIKKNAITCTLEDMKSANGTILNGERINAQQLTDEDEFLIGSTSFIIKIQSDFIQQEKDRIMPVEENQIVEVEEIVEVDENFDDPDANFVDGDGLGSGQLDTGPKSLFSKEALKDPEQRKKLLYIVVGLLAAWVLLEEEPKEKPVPKKDASAEVKEKPVVGQQGKVEKILTPEEKEYVESQYLLAQQYFSDGKYSETIMELDKIFTIVDNYKKSRQIKALAKEGLEQLSRILEEKRKEKERRERDEKVKSLVAEAKDAVNNNQVPRAESLFKEILKLDPENFEVTQLKLQIEAYVKEQERIALEKAQKEAERKRQIQELAPGKNFFLAKDWYKATLKLSDFLKLEGMDEDLVREASDMLQKSKQNLNSVVNPLIGKARSLKEGQDLKGAYQLYLDVLNYHPANEEALNEMDNIRVKLETRSKKIFREAIIAESLSLYEDAKEKFQEVQQISPTDSDYYKKATEKLKDYIE